MMRQVNCVGVLILLACIAGCSQNTPSPPPFPTTAPSVPTSSPPLETQVREAFRQPDPDLRRDQILAAVDAFLRDDAIRQTDDMVATNYFNEIAFSSGRLTLADPAIIQRQGSRAMVLLPEGMGLYLFDIALENETLELSRWTIGLDDLQVFWGDTDIGVQYATSRRDGIARPHFMLAVRRAADWQLAWSSDESPDWWFNADGGRLEVAGDLSELRLVGESSNTTTYFYEQPGEPRREFVTTWRRQEDYFEMLPALSDFKDRSAWFQAVAVPSPYATLVAFIERLDTGDGEGATGLTANPEVLQAVADFGLDDPTRRYQVIAYEEDRIVFRDVRGTFDATFDAPTTSGLPWLINRLAPLGAASTDSTTTEGSPSP